MMWVSSDRRGQTEPSGLLTHTCRFVPQVLHLQVQWVFPVCAADSIEANVENAEAHVQSGTQQLARASDYQVNPS